jgi:hypothetical protein
MSDSILIKPIPRVVKFVFIILLSVTFNLPGIAQEKMVYGRVYAFKDLALKNIDVTTSKSKTSVKTDSLGRFKINCQLKDKLELTGNGFKKLSYKVDFKESRIINFKMIFKGGEKNIELAVENNHVSRADLENSLLNHPYQNYEYYGYADIFDAISKIYASNDNISVRGKKVFVRRENSTYSASPAIWILNGKLALDVSDILTSNIESIEIIPDGSSQYGPGAANGVVFIKTFK